MGFTRNYLLVSCLVLSGMVTGVGEEPLTLHRVALSVQSPRLLGMSMDEDGCIWLGSTHRKIYCYHPTSGAVEELQLPYDSSTSQTICVGKKVYLLGQTYPKLMIYDRLAGKFSEANFPTAAPDVWYGTEPIDGRHFYLFDRSSKGVIKWDTTTDTGKLISCHYQGPSPALGRYVASDRAVWCGMWDFTGGQYVPLGIARLDTQSDEFTGWFPFPQESATRDPFTHAAETLFYPHTLKGKLIPFDLKERRWCQAIDVPEFGQRFGFIGLGTIHQGRWYFSISTYDGDQTGCDGKPYHFCNGLLEFDPQTSRFAFPTLEVAGAYFQVAYTLSAGGHLFATGNNILEQDGSLNMGKTGEAVFWQTLHPKNE